MKHLVRRSIFASVITASLLLLAGCGVSSGTANATQTARGAETSATATASATTSAVATATLQAGTVAVVLDKTQYTTSDTIDATILNGLDHTIYAADHQTDCTVLAVEQQTSTGWQQVGMCLRGSVTRLIPIAASSRTQTPLDIGQAGNGGVVWGAGVYRVALTYLNSDSDIVAAGTTIYSATFTLN